MSEYKYQTLGDNAVPKSYDIVLKTNMKTFKYYGTETVALSVREPCRNVRMNARELSVLDAEVRCGGVSQKARVGYDAKREEINLSFAREIHGDAAVTINFSGENNDKMYGFYRSRYETDGKEGYILTSQFEAADARAAFPCFDEPGFKATFGISIEVDEDLDAISNMPIESVKKLGKGRKRVAFSRTPRMSPYLVYLGVGKYDYVVGKLDGMPIRVATVPGKRKLGRLGLEYAKKFVSFFNDYFGIKYPMPKLDLLAIPDFSAGAMENWGAITFREIAILGDDKQTPIAVRQSIAETIAHELAHQWFGDLVTMKWWDDLWLNESFATFMSYKAMAAVFPEWNVDKQYFDEVIATAFTADALKATHPISVHVSTPKEIDQIFDSISYEKGGTVLHMLENFAGKDTFRKGLHDYLKAHAYGNATKYDLWGAVGRASKKGNPRDIEDFASAWINNPGYPILDVIKRGRKATVTQKRFLMVGSAGETERWPIPLKQGLGTKDVDDTILTKKSGQISLDGSDWMKLNYGQHYLYRVRYPKDMLDGLGKAIADGSITGTDAWGVENDLFVLARSGKVRLVEYLGFVGDYCMEPDYPLSFNLASHLSWVRMMLDKTNREGMADSVSKDYYSKVFGKLGWEKKRGEDSTSTMLRGIAISGLGHLGDGTVIKTAMETFNGYMEGRGGDPDLKGAVYGIAAWNGGRKEYDRVVARYKKEQSPDDKRRLLQTLALFRDEKLLAGTLEFAFSKHVRLQDSYVLPAIMSSNPSGYELVWDWTRSNWKLIMGKYESGTHMLERFVTNLSSLRTEQDMKDVKAFFGKEENMRDDIRLRTKQALERMRANINFMKANGLS